MRLKARPPSPRIRVMGEEEERKIKRIKISKARTQEERSMIPSRIVLLGKYVTAISDTEETLGTAWLQAHAHGKIDVSRGIEGPAGLGRKKK